MKLCSLYTLYLERWKITQSCVEMGVDINTRDCIELYAGFIHVIGHIYTLISKYFFNQRTSSGDDSYYKNGYFS